MFRKYVLTALIAASVATAPILTPAAYAKNDLEKLLIGLAAIGIVGAIANEHKQKKRQRVSKQQTHYNHTHNERHRHGDLVHKHKHKNGHHRGDHRPVKHHHRQKQKHVHQYEDHKPRVCLRKKWTNHGWQKFYSKRCLRKHGYAH